MVEERVLSIHLVIENSGVSHAAHAGGMIFGMFFSMCFLRNIVKEHHWRTYMQYLAGLLSVAIFVFAMVWVFTNDKPTPLFMKLLEKFKN